MKTRTIHITADLDAIIRQKIARLEALSNRQAVDEGQLLAYREVLRLAHGGIAE